MNPDGSFCEVAMREQKIKQDICIGANIREIRRRQGLKQTELAGLLQLEGIPMTREALVKIERGAQHIQASQLRAIKNALNVSYDELLEP
ncbi:helix-turn-helix domain-containing protein [uncultured Oscillibacter sp.]|uniref:helix-turn-helix domain-containing protein n=2 Tax=Oscillibacter TaxID=459786 RepID=UPI00345D91C0